MERYSLGKLRICFKWGKPLLIGLILILLALVMFVILARDVMLKSSFGFDSAILTALNHAASTGLTKFMLFVSDTASELFLIPVLLLLLALWWRGHKQDWIALIAAVGGVAVLNQVIKTLVERTRPDLFPHLQVVTGYSFPSGHSQAALAFYSVLAYLVARRVNPKWRIPIYVAAGAWIILVGLSRNYLEVHYPSDVLAAFAITLPWALFVIFVHQCYEPPVRGEEKVIKPAPGAEPAHSGGGD
jgi:undecaprenyl-diphosphatase